jgi:hypothetical protein
MASCVVYKADASAINSGQIDDAAQQTALEHSVPMAVIYCLEHWEAPMVELLKQYEAKLQAKNIPLIVLIGSKDKMFRAFLHHTHPLNVFDKPAQTTVDELVYHPFSWPGVVIPVQKLQELHDAGSLVC